MLVQNIPDEQQADTLSVGLGREERREKFGLHLPRDFRKVTFLLGQYGCIFYHSNDSVWLMGKLEFTTCRIITNSMIRK